MSTQQAWHKEFSIETTADPEAIWALFCDVPGWTNWNAGIESIEVEGPFADGTWFTMKPPGQDALRSRFVEVRPNEYFVDETRMGDLIVRVAHRIEGIELRRTRVTYAVKVTGTDAPQIGAAIASDFPDVLAALASLAEKAALVKSVPAQMGTAPAMQTA